ncbi:MAG: single-stranded DNA-binding protein [Alphaproteobacteria bacterium]|nr:single-stranded DNA-binding protein [Alphaproteobacteria bacterium]
MAGSVNKVILVGNVGRDPEIRHSQDGQKIVNFSLATSESWKDKATGERQDRTEWHRVVVFNPNLADVIERYVKKGSKLYVEGQIQSRKWTDQAGVEKLTTEIVLSRFKGELTLLDSRSDMDHGSSVSYGGGSSSAAIASKPRASQDMALDDDIPF